MTLQVLESAIDLLDDKIAQSNDVLYSYTSKITLDGMQFITFLVLIDGKHEEITSTVAGVLNHKMVEYRGFDALVGYGFKLVAVAIASDLSEFFGRTISLNEVEPE